MGENTGVVENQSNFQGTQQETPKKVENKEPEENNSSPKIPEKDEEIKNPEFKYKLLTEKKKLQEERDQLRKQLQERETQELENQQKYKELYESARKENEEIRKQIEESRTKEETNKKLAYLTKELKKQGAKEERLEFLLRNADVSSIKYDEEHGVFYGHEEEAAKLKSALPEVFGKNTANFDQTNTDLKTEGHEYKTFRDIPLSKRKDRNFMKSWYESQGIQVRK